MQERAGLHNTMWEEPGDFGATGELGGKQQRMEGGRPGAGRFCAAVGTTWDRAGRKSPTRNGQGTLKNEETQCSVGSCVNCWDAEPSFIPSKFSKQPSACTHLLRVGGSSGI